MPRRHSSFDPIDMLHTPSIQALLLLTLRHIVVMATKSRLAFCALFSVDAILLQVGEPIYTILGLLSSGRLLHHFRPRNVVCDYARSILGPKKKTHFFITMILTIPYYGLCGVLATLMKNVHRRMHVTSFSGFLSSYLELVCKTVPLASLLAIYLCMIFEIPAGALAGPDEAMVGRLIFISQLIYLGVTQGLVNSGRRVQQLMREHRISDSLTSNLPIKLNMTSSQVILASFQALPSLFLQVVGAMTAFFAGQSLQLIIPILVNISSSKGSPDLVILVSFLYTFVLDGCICYLSMRLVVLRPGLRVVSLSGHVGAWIRLTSLAKVSGLAAACEAISTSNVQAMTLLSLQVLSTAIWRILAVTHQYRLSGNLLFLEMVPALRMHHCFLDKQLARLPPPPPPPDLNDDEVEGIAATRTTLTALRRRLGRLSSFVLEATHPLASGKLRQVEAPRIADFVLRAARLLVESTPSSEDRRLVNLYESLLGYQESCLTCTDPRLLVRATLEAVATYISVLRRATLLKVTLAPFIQSQSSPPDRTCCDDAYMSVSLASTHPLNDTRSPTYSSNSFVPDPPLHRTRSIGESVEAALHMTNSHPLQRPPPILHHFRHVAYPASETTSGLTPVLDIETLSVSSSHPGAPSHLSSSHYTRSSHSDLIYADLSEVPRFPIPVATSFPTTPDRRAHQRYGRKERLYTVRDVEVLNFFAAGTRAGGELCLPGHDIFRSVAGLLEAIQEHEDQRWAFILTYTVCGTLEPASYQAYSERIANISFYLHYAHLFEARIYVSPDIQREDAEESIGVLVSLVDLLSDPPEIFGLHLVTPLNGVEIQALDLVQTHQVVLICKTLQLFVLTMEKLRKHLLFQKLAKATLVRRRHESSLVLSYTCHCLSCSKVLLHYTRSLVQSHDTLLFRRLSRFARENYLAVQGALAIVRFTQAQANAFTPQLQACAEAICGVQLQLEHEGSPQCLFELIDSCLCSTSSPISDIIPHYSQAGLLRYKSRHSQISEVIASVTETRIRAPRSLICAFNLVANLLRYSLDRVVHLHIYTSDLLPTQMEQSVTGTTHPSGSPGIVVEIALGRLPPLFEDIGRAIMQTKWTALKTTEIFSNTMLVPMQEESSRKKRSQSCPHLSGMDVVPLPRRLGSKRACTDLIADEVIWDALDRLAVYLNALKALLLGRCEFCTGPQLSLRLHLRRFGDMPPIQPHPDQGHPISITPSLEEASRSEIDGVLSEPPQADQGKRRDTILSLMLEDIKDERITKVLACIARTLGISLIPGNEEGLLHCLLIHVEPALTECKVRLTLDSHETVVSPTLTGFSTGVEKLLRTWNSIGVR
ncbi:hypothetical protein GMRT_10955 [Giardia muris]|uniref:Uncharacterized protein n=1 Tax=Giardia muris TaxID=5742 RepID=A0A4Z1SUH8_GIAMU|nr:hypothetical protein GMRT_10955 [Giardia muris]|eukprot:TNJ29360.1 hypothetical protein GMRT_10955 [Giardia muris]